MMLICINKAKGLWCLILRSLRIFSIRRIPGVKIGLNLQLLGAPIIEMCAGGRLSIGDGCVLRSVNPSYHANLYAPVKLKVSVSGAEIRIGNGTKIYGSSINAFKRITIGNKCLIAANCHFFDSNGHLPCFDDLDNRMLMRDEGREIVIEDYVWIGLGCIILPGVHIGRGSIIGAGSVVTKDIPPMCVAAGNPAKVIRYYEGKEI